MSSTDYSSKLTRTISNIVIDNIDKPAIRNEAFDAGYWDPNDLHKYIRDVVLVNGKTRCNTAELVNLYTYAYCLMHVDAFKTAVYSASDKTFSNIYFNDYKETLLVDFGCGPGTVALALTEMWVPQEDEPLSPLINYMGIDIEEEMILLAEEFFNSPLFNDKLRIIRSRCGKIIRVRNGIRPRKIIFVFNYLFSQLGVVESIEYFIEKMKSIISLYTNIDDIYLMYSNINSFGEENAFKVFLEELESEGMLESGTSDISFIKGYNYTFRKFNNLDGNDIDMFEGTTRYVHTDVFKLYRP